MTGKLDKAQNPALEDILITVSFASAVVRFVRHATLLPARGEALRDDNNVASQCAWFHYPNISDLIFSVHVYSRSSPSVDSS